MTSESGFAVGTRVANKYEIARVIGSGGMGVVYEAVHLELRKRVAIKILHAEYARQPMAHQRFVREGEAASRIRHPHVVDVTDIGSHEGTPYLVMEYLDGLDLGAHLEKKAAALPLPDALDLLMPVIAAVAAGHDEGVIHRDLKPHNIFLARGRHGEVHPKVLDFGVSKVTGPLTGESNLTASSAVMGTIAYMSPEQAMGAKQVDARSDQYSLALILYECVTGRQAHQGENALAVLRQIGDGGISPPRVHVPSLPAAFEEVLLRALSVDPRQRFPTMDAFGRALMRFAGARTRSLSQSLFQREGTPIGGIALAPTAVRGTVDETPEPAMPLTTPLTPVGPVTPVRTTLSNSAAEIATADTRGGPRRTVLLVAAGVVVAAGIFAVVKGRKSPEPRRDPTPPVEVEAPPPVAPPPAPAAPRTFKFAVQVTPTEATFELDGAPAGAGRLERELPLDGQPHTLRAVAPGFSSRTVTFVDTPPPEAIALEKLPATETRRTTRRPAQTGVEQRPASPAAPAGPAVGANQAPILKE